MKYNERQNNVARYNDSVKTLCDRSWLCAKIAKLSPNAFRRCEKKNERYRRIQFTTGKHCRELHAPLFFIIKFQKPKRIIDVYTIPIVT